MSFTKLQVSELRSRQIQDSRFSVFGFWGALRQMLLDKQDYIDQEEKSETKQCLKQEFSFEKWRMHPDGFVLSDNVITWFELDCSHKTSEEKLVRLAYLDEELWDFAGLRLQVLIATDHSGRNDSKVFSEVLISPEKLNEIFQNDFMSAVLR